MNFSNWMSYIKDDVKLIDVVMPGSHNAGTRKMIPIARCQDSTLAEQFEHGVRLFSVRLSENCFGKVVFSHSIVKGVSLEGELKALKAVIDENPSEFIIIDICDYPNLTVGPIKFDFGTNPTEVDSILDACLDISRYALTDFNKISDVTMGDIRKSGKRILLINSDKKYKYSVNCDFKNPWSSERHGRLPNVFVERATEVFDQEEKNGIFILQTQLTPGLESEVKLISPYKLNLLLKPYYHRIFEIIKNNPKYLSAVNVVSGDFMAQDDEKIKQIIELNLCKNNISDIKEFAELIK